MTAEMKFSLIIVSGHCSSIYFINVICYYRKICVKICVNVLNIIRIYTIHDHNSLQILYTTNYIIYSNNDIFLLLS